MQGATTKEANAKTDEKITMARLYDIPHPTVCEIVSIRIPDSSKASGSSLSIPGYAGKMAQPVGILPDTYDRNHMTLDFVVDVKGKRRYVAIEMYPKRVEIYAYSDIDVKPGAKPARDKEFKTFIDSMAADILRLLTEEEASIKPRT